MRRWDRTSEDAEKNGKVIDPHSLLLIVPSIEMMPGHLVTTTQVCEAFPPIRQA